MATRIRSQAELNSPDQPGISDPPQGEPEGTENQPTDPPAGPTNEPDPNAWAPPSREYVDTLEQQLRVQNQQIQQLIDAQTQPAPRVEAPPAPRDVEAEKQRFYGDPIESTREVVRRELQEAIAPLQDFVKAFKATSIYDELKLKFKTNPVYVQFGQHLNDPQIEAAVDQVMAQAEKNDNTLRAAILHVLGLKTVGALEGAMGNQPAPTPAPTNQPAPTNEPSGGPRVNTPAHIRPSNPNPPTRTAQSQRRQLNELEMRLARERWPNDPAATAYDKYLNWLELPAAHVVRAEPDGKLKA